VKNLLAYLNGKTKSANEVKEMAAAELGAKLVKFYIEANLVNGELHIIKQL